VAKRLEDMGHTVRKVSRTSGISIDNEKALHIRHFQGRMAERMEEKLNKLGIEELMILRCAFFMEKFLRGMNFLRQAQCGYFSSAFRGDIPMSIIACNDI
jgi:hypothetical protein